MPFIDITTEQTTAATDAILALLALGCCLYLLSLGRYNPWKTRVWAGAFGLLTLAAVLGTIAHGFKMAEQTRELLWQPLNLALGLTIALFVVGVVYDVWGLAASRRVLWPMLAVGVGFFVVARLIPGTFLVFVIYQGVAMLFALGAYIWLAVQQRLNGAWLMAAGVLVTIIAAGIQASQAVLLTLIWQFNHNGIYHFIQMAGVILLTTGLRAALVTKPKN
jgi:hypothetical protein